MTDGRGNLRGNRVVQPGESVLKLGNLHCCLLTSPGVVQRRLSQMHSDRMGGQIQVACSKENSDQTLRKSSSCEGWAKPESGCLGKFWTPQPCRYSRLEKVQKSWSFFAVSSALRRELEGMMFRGLLQPRLLYCSMRSQLDYIAS